MPLELKIPCRLKSETAALMPGYGVKLPFDRPHSEGLNGPIPRNLLARIERLLLRPSLPRQSVFSQRPRRYSALPQVSRIRTLPVPNAGRAESSEWRGTWRAQVTALTTAPELAFPPATNSNLSITLRLRVSEVGSTSAGRHTIEVLEQVFRDRMRNLQ